MYGNLALSRAEFVSARFRKLLASSFSLVTLSCNRDSPAPPITSTSLSSLSQVFSLWGITSPSSIHQAEYMRYTIRLSPYDGLLRWDQSHRQEAATRRLTTRTISLYNHG
ncbi:hypothetical protein BD309DRAFT_945510 [Dichomitus squalens]|nr:hypothetical protein BD309DRAFT_945510 [Dichomitus squalens]